MRTVDLGRTAAQAELVRLKRLVRRQAMRAVWGAVAAVFLIAVLVMVHVVAYMALVPALLSPLLGAVAILVFDLVVAGIFGLMAKNGAPDAVEAEAKAVRDEALVGMRQSLAVSALLSPVTRLILRSRGGKSAWGMMLATLAASVMSNRRQ